MSEDSSVSVLPSGQLSLSSSRSHAGVVRHILCSKLTHPNALGCQVPVPSKLNIPSWKSALDNDSDSVVAHFLLFGWPINYRSNSVPTPSKSNHPSALRFPDAINSVVAAEISHGATIGSFLHNPFPSLLQTSPLQTVPKDDFKRRIVLDLSFPPGASVYDGIPKDSFLDKPFHLSHPRSADFADRIIAKGPVCFLFKKDLRAHRQILVDPRDYNLLGYHWNDFLYFDLVLPFGLRSPTLACQRTTNAIAHIFYSVYQCVNYIDDFGGEESLHGDAFEAFQDLEALFDRLGLEASLENDCPPSTRMVLLSLIYDTVSMTLEVPDDKLSRAFALIRLWLSSPRYTKSDLQSLIGKLSYICACISPGKNFHAANAF